MSRFLRYFWPKDAREAARRFEEAGTLNQQAVNYLDNIILIHQLLVWLFISSALYLTGGRVEKNIAIAFVVLMPIFMLWDTYWVYRRKMVAYVHGKKVSAISLGSSSSLYGSQLHRYMLAQDNSKKGVMRIGGKPRMREEDFFVSGQKLFIYRDDEGKYAMPDVAYLKRTYSLTTSIFEESDYE